MIDKPYRVLIVDDSPEDRALCRRFLTESDERAYHLSEAESGTEGLERCRAEQPDCVLLDYKLPDVDGLEFLNELAREGRDKATAVVMLTGQGNETVAVQVMKKGVQDYLIKGKLTAKTLRRALQHAIELTDLRRQIEEQRRELERLATMDSLTGIYNRRVFLERLEHECHRSRRYGSQLCVMLLDLDHFKHINDTHGHLVGDQVLTTVGMLLRTALRSTDVSARYGGEEFGILLPETGLGPATDLAERLRERLAAQAFCLGGPMFRVTCSIGLARLANAKQASGELLTRADRALYRAKEAGRNRVVAVTDR